MTDEEIREKFHMDQIADKATAAVRDRVGGEDALTKTEPLNVILSTAEEVYLMGWRDAEANRKAED